jgi:SAM-dependent methyltransferase
MDYQPMTFGQRFADTYDELGQRPDTTACVDLLEQLAGGGPVLELAVGTGRVALPLAARGLRVDGVEASPEMVAQLRAKAGGSQLAVTIGDMKDVPVSGRYRLIYLVFNTLFNLVTQDDQVACFANVAAHLSDDGVFVVEAGVPDLGRFRGDQEVSASLVDLDAVQLTACRLDAAAQRWDTTHLRFAGGASPSLRLYPVTLRYVWPAEMDLMARLAGLRLIDRWAGWRREAYVSASTSHVSVYGR